MDRLRRSEDEDDKKLTNDSIGHGEIGPCCHGYWELFNVASVDSTALGQQSSNGPISSTFRVSRVNRNLVKVFDWVAASYEQDRPYFTR